MALNPPASSSEANGFSRAYRRRQRESILRPSLDLDFTKGQVGPLVQFSRASSGSFIGADGRLQTSRYNFVQRSDPGTAVAGTPGTQPIGWSMALGATNGVTRNIVNVGSIDGVGFMDVSFSGTFVADESFGIQPPPGISVVPASAGQAWLFAMEWGVLSGVLPPSTLAGANGGSRVRFGNPGILGDGYGGTVSRAWGSGVQVASAVAPAATTTVGGQWLWMMLAGQSINCVIRFGLAQMERASSFAEYIPTYGVDGGAPRFDCDPANVVEQNLVYNSGFIGVPVGLSIGSINGWGVNSAGGIVTSVVGAGSLPDGARYVDVNFRGVAGAAGPYYPNFFLGASFLAEVTPLSTVRHSFRAAVIGGSIPSTPPYVGFNGNNLSTFTESFLIQIPNRGGLVSYSATRTFSNTATNRAACSIQLSVASNEVIDVTVRVADLQTVRGTLALPYVMTTPTTGLITRCAMRGLLMEEQRTNSLRNSEAAGAVTGIPGTMPTNWIPTVGGGLTQEVVRTGVEDGFNYIDVRVSGTTTDALGWRVFFEGTTQIAAVTGQVWTNSFYCSLVGGSVANAIFNVRILELDAAGTYLIDSFVPFTLTAGALSQRRHQHTRTFNNALTAFAQPMLFVQIASGVAVDFTLRIAAPQMEICPTVGFASSYIPTTGTAATRAADAASISGNNFSSWYRQGGGTFWSEYLIDPAIPSGQFPVLLQADDGLSNNRVQLFAQTGTTDGAGSRGDFSGGVQWNTGPALFAPKGAITRAVVAYSTNDVAVTYNGLAVAPDPSATIPTLTTLGIGKRSDLATALSRVIRRIQYYPTRLSNEVIQGLSA